MAAERIEGCLETILAKGIVLINDGDALIGISNQLINHRRNLSAITRAQIEHHAQFRSPEQAGAGHRSHQWDSGLLDQGQHRLGRRCPHITEKSQQLWAQQQVPGVANGLIRLVLVIKADQADLSTMNTAALVHRIEPGHGAAPVIETNLS